MNSKTMKLLFMLTLAFVVGMWVMYMVKDKLGAAEEKDLVVTEAIKIDKNSHQEKHAEFEESIQATSNQLDIEQLTNEKVVVAYLKKHKELPDYYIKKSEAKRQGWVPSKGNLCEVIPGKAIGGDYFSNRQGSLPKSKSRKYFEADINYDCGRRDAERLVYSNDGLIFITKDHYKTFQQL